MIASVQIGAVENKLNDNTDVTVELDDGRVYSFTAFTPLNLMSLINQESLGYFLCEDMLVLGAIDEKNVRSAVEEMLEDDNIDRFGLKAD